MNNGLTVVSQDALSLITKAEIDMQISTAKAFPRSVKESIDKALSIASISQEVAESCIYAIPRGGKKLEGPSVRLAEIVASSFGNIRTGARVIANDGKTVTAQGICHDLETNNCVTVEVRKSILDRNGNTYSEDMQVVTGNAACAIAFRNVVFKVIPAALVESVYEKVKLVAKGTSETLEVRRSKAVNWLQGKGISDKQICDTLAVKKIGDIDLEKLATLTQYKTAINNGDTTLEEVFAEQVVKPVLSENDLQAAIEEIKKGNATAQGIVDLYDVLPVQSLQLVSAENGK
jgi:hypothetical protein